MKLSITLLILAALSGCDSYFDSEWSNAQRDYARICSEVESDRRAWDLLVVKDVSQSLKDIYADCGEGFDKYYSEWSIEKTNYAQNCAIGKQRSGHTDWMSAYDECGQAFDKLDRDHKKIIRDYEREIIVMECIKGYHAIPVALGEDILTDEEVRLQCIYKRNRTEREAKKAMK